MAEPVRVGCMYFGTALRGAADLHDRALLDGLDRKRFDTMIGTGLSGTLVIPRLAETMGKAWCVVRKSNDNSHARGLLEGRIGRRWVFVDDFMDSGSTFRRVKRAVDGWAEQTGNETQFVGAYFYERGELGNGWRPPAKTIDHADRWGSEAV